MISVCRPHQASGLLNMKNLCGLVPLVTVAILGLSLQGWQWSKFRSLHLNTASVTAEIRTNHSSWTWLTSWPFDRCISYLNDGLVAIPLVRITD